MNQATDRLYSLRVADVMNRGVVTVKADQSMSEAAAEFARWRIAAAPVVGADGDCVGILSATDFLRREAENGSRATCGNAAAMMGPPRERVADFMSHAVQTVAPETTLLAAARIMCVQHVHRLVVLDSHERPIGVVSTMDVVASLVGALDEMTATNSTIGAAQN